jgi:protein SCO1/2
MLPGSAARGVRRCAYVFVPMHAKTRVFAAPIGTSTDSEACCYLAIVGPRYDCFNTGESDVARNFDSLSGDHISLVAAVLAAMAAIFMVAFWAPLQVRAFAQATESVQPAGPVASETSTSGRWINVPFVTADGNATSLAASNGQVRVVTMMYTHCPGICPLALSTLQRMDSHLTPAQQRRISIVALSLDPERDSVARLREFQDARGIASPRWIVGHPSIEGTRRLAAAMGVDYRVVGDGTVDHQSVFVLLGRNGQVLARSSNTRNVDPTFFAALQAAAAAN